MTAASICRAAIGKPPKLRNKRQGIVDNGEDGDIGAPRGAAPRRGKELQPRRTPKSLPTFQEVSEQGESFLKLRHRRWLFLCRGLYKRDFRFL